MVNNNSFNQFILLICISLFGISNCIRFKVDELKLDLNGRIKIGEGIDKIEAKISNNAITNIPLHIPLSADRLFVTDIKNASIKVFLKNGKLDYVIGSPKMKDEKVRFLNLKVSNPGAIAVSADDEIYIQNRVTQRKEDSEEEIDPFTVSSGYFAFREPIYIPSYIIQIASSKEKTNVLGVSGKDSEPFGYIESMYAGDDGKLFVVHRKAEEFILSYYRKGKLIGNISESSLEIYQTPESKNYLIKLDKMLPDLSGSFAILSFSYIGKTDQRFKFRRIYKFTYNTTKETSLLKEFQDPSEILFGIKSNKEFYIWETENEGDAVKLKVHDSEGNHISNKKLVFPEPRTSWRETYMGYKDNIYSIKIDSGYLEIYEWK